MTYSIPTKSVYTIARPKPGTPPVPPLAVWSLQRTLNERGISVAEDGVFGVRTESAVRELQTKLGVNVDGVAGPKTQNAVAAKLAARQRLRSELPDKLLDSQIALESGGLLAAVNWGSPGGVDCGLVQRRIYAGAYGDVAQMMRAFDPSYQLDLLGNDLRKLHDLYLARSGTLQAADPNEMAWRLAVLNHNYPYAADTISRIGLSYRLPAYFTTPQDWVVDARVKFTDGVEIKTPLEWCQHYSLGNSARNDPGQAVKFVVDWSK